MAGQLGSMNVGAQLATAPLRGESSIFTLDQTLASRAISLTGMPRQVSQWSDQFITRPGSAGSLWRNLNGSDVVTMGTVPGGVLQLYSNTTYGAAVIDPNGNYPFGVRDSSPSFVGVINSLNPLYFFFRFRLMPDPGTGGPGGWDSSINSVVLGIVDDTTLDVLGVGVALGRTFFGAVGGNLLTPSNTVGVNSLVPQDFSVWHDGEIFSRHGHWWVKIDDGEAIDCGSIVSVTMVGGTPIMQVMTTGVLQPAVEIDHCSYIVPANRNQISNSPAHPYP
jgi:hypothetical protein